MKDILRKMSNNEKETQDHKWEDFPAGVALVLLSSKFSVIITVSCCKKELEGVGIHVQR